MSQMRNSVPEASTQKLHGLINQGSTCYLNSVLQVLFMTKDFRESVKRCPKDKEYIDPQLRNLFKNLSTRTARTVEVTEKLEIERVNEQHDAAEYLEKILTQTSDEASQIFKGELVHRTVCECGAVTDEKKPFWNLPLPLRSSSNRNYSVVDGIEDFFKVSHLVGDDQLFCEKCESKSDSTAECVIERHPEVLMLLLKRFEFNYHQMSYVKNRCVVEVPLTVEIPQNHKYKLYAFVEHFGSLRSGHYTATIRSKENKDSWYNFNDSSVTKLNNQPFKERRLEKSESAYLLFYRSKKDTDLQNNTDLSNNPRPPLDSHTSSCQRGSKRKKFDEEGDKNKTKKTTTGPRDKPTDGLPDISVERGRESKLRIEQTSSHVCAEEVKGLSGHSRGVNVGKRDLEHNQHKQRNVENENQRGNVPDSSVVLKTQKSTKESDRSSETGHAGREEERIGQQMQKIQAGRRESRDHRQGKNSLRYEREAFSDEQNGSKPQREYREDEQIQGQRGKEGRISVNRDERRERTPETNPHPYESKITEHWKTSSNIPTENMKPKPAAHHKNKISSVELNSDDVEGILPMNDSPTQAGSETEEGSKQKAVIEGNEKTHRFWRTVRRRFNCKKTKKIQADKQNENVEEAVGMIPKRSNAKKEKGTTCCCFC
ncbi:uncharacterized protein [Nothobranchius furzeri]|uniref:Ubiquitin carboxyl-terminal hydrolase n=1 Tax=Nothobranchius furzeri TaxID=105023 RepID=A0A1A8A110_NOTFU|nr:transcript variant X1 [Nothobranchius furzeri]